MRIIDADELMEHVWRDKLDSRELIAQMIDNAPPVKEISTKIPIDIFEQLISQKSKTGHWIHHSAIEGFKYERTPYECSCCNKLERESSNFCPNCGAKMEEEE